MLNKRLISILAAAAMLKKKDRNKNMYDPNPPNGPEEHSCHVHKNINRWILKKNRRKKKNKRHGTLWCQRVFETDEQSCTLKSNKEGFPAQRGGVDWLCGQSPWRKEKTDKWELMVSNGVQFIWQNVCLSMSLGFDLGLATFTHWFLWTSLISCNSFHLMWKMHVTGYYCFQVSVGFYRSRSVWTAFHPHSLFLRSKKGVSCCNKTLIPRFTVKEVFLHQAQLRKFPVIQW